MRRPMSEILQSLGPPPKPDIPEAYRAAVPPRTLWFRRPAPWSDGKLAPAKAAVQGQILADRLSLHHDANEALPSVDFSENDGLTLSAPGFDGSFLSLALGMSLAEVNEIHHDDIVRLTLRLSLSKPLQTYARLVLLSGPNRAEVPREVVASDEGNMLEWDLMFTNFDPVRAVDAWIDLIFERPVDATITIHDLYMLRHPRANF
jgi:Family of unknown function (DUF6478)